MSTSKTTTPAAAPVDPRDEALQQYKTLRVGPVGQRMGPMDEFLRVANLPADRCVTWATDPRIDNGRHLAFVKSLGYRTVEVDEVTTNPAVDGKLLLNQFEEGPHRTVSLGGGVLMIGYRQYRDELREQQSRTMRERVDAEVSKLDDIGVEQHATSKRADLTEVVA
jgi:hypothetical protein